MTNIKRIKKELKPKKGMRVIDVILWILTINTVLLIGLFVRIILYFGL